MAHTLPDMTQVDEAKPGFLPLIGGVLLLVLSLGLAGVAWESYQRGVPGVPTTPPEQEGAIVLFAPPDVEFDTYIDYRQKGDPSNEFASDAMFMWVTVKTARKQPFAIVAGFHGDARVSEYAFLSEINLAGYQEQERRRFSPLGNDNRFFEGPEVPGPDIVQYTFDVARKGMAPGEFMTLFDGALVHPVFAKDNSRITARTKRFDHVIRCSALGDPEFALSLSHQRWVDLGLATCRNDFVERSRSPINKGQKTIVTLAPACKNPRLDYAVRPAGSLASLGWEFPGDTVASVSASLTDLDEEARGQSYLFGSGVAVGLATSLLPGSLKVVYDWTRRRRRAGAGRQAPAPPAQRGLPANRV